MNKPIFTMMMVLIMAFSQSVNADTTRFHATNCIPTTDYNSVSRSEYRITNSTAASINVYCPVEVPEWQNTPDRLRVFVSVEDQSNALNVSCTLSIRRDHGYEVTSRTASSTGVGIQSLTMEIPRDEWDPIFTHEGKFAASLHMSCTLPPNGTYGYFRIYSYGVQQF